MDIIWHLSRSFPGSWNPALLVLLWDGVLLGLSNGEHLSGPALALNLADTSGSYAGSCLPLTSEPALALTLSCHLETCVCLSECVWHTCIVQSDWVLVLVQPSWSCPTKACMQFSCRDNWCCSWVGELTYLGDSGPVGGIVSWFRT